ncbi:adhesion G protein-coupled receptor E3-like [Colossoma macropomum]|uniref:adhesion G protein-coupled receptor E3-like n=1 Tax=Colossoma macropomum TaxID=42526 RepID=UPI001864B9B3|nr:adhesion G protein-coupled receptor E3-like [Colossoma macropomum]
MQASGFSKNTRSLNMLNTVAVSVGLFFLFLALLTFAVCRRNPKVINAALINLCISLFLAHLLFLLTQKFLLDIASDQLLCAVMAGVLHFLFLCAFVWMFIEAVLLFIFVKNLTQIRPKQMEMLSWKCLTVIGYVIPLTMVGVSVGLVPEGYGSEQCWLKINKGFRWSFLGPVCVILASNLILFISIGVLMVSTLRKLNNEVLQTKLTRSDNDLIKRVMLKVLLQFVIIGCSWILGFFTENNEVINILFIIFNSQQGTFIFFIHCVFNHEIRQQYKKFLSSSCILTKTAPKPSRR